MVTSALQRADRVRRVHPLVGHVHARSADVLRTAHSPPPFVPPGRLPSSSDDFGTPARCRAPIHAGHDRGAGRGRRGSVGSSLKRSRDGDAPRHVLGLVGAVPAAGAAARAPFQVMGRREDEQAAFEIELGLGRGGWRRRVGHGTEWCQPLRTPRRRTVALVRRSLRGGCPSSRRRPRGRVRRRCGSRRPRAWRRSGG